MPIVIPTRDEVAKMTSRDREKWRNRLGVTHDQVRDTKNILRFDTDTALDAHWWLMHIGPDPHAREHWAALEKVLST